MSDQSEFESANLSPATSTPQSSPESIMTHSHSFVNSRVPKNVDINVLSNYDMPQCSVYDVSLTDSDRSTQEGPKILNASSPSSICSARPLEWDSGADVGYDLTPQTQNLVMSTIERIAVNNLVFNANSTPIDLKNKNVKQKSASLTDLVTIESFKDNKSVSYEMLSSITTKCDTVPKSKPHMTSCLSVSTVVYKTESLKSEEIKLNNDLHINTIAKEQNEMFKKLNITSDKELEKSKDSNNSLGSVGSADSWEAKQFCDSTNTTTDRVNSFEYIPGDEYFESREDVRQDSLDNESSTQMLIEAMKQNGLTQLQRKEMFKVIDSFIKNYKLKDNSLPKKSTTDSDHTNLRQDITSQTSYTGNTVVNNQTNNHSSTITFTSPITSSQYGDEIDSKCYDTSKDSETHLKLRKYKFQKKNIPNKQTNRGVQCNIQDCSTKCNQNEISKPSTSKFIPIINKQTEQLPKLQAKNKEEIKSNYNNPSKEFKKQMIWFHNNYMKVERENQMFWINTQITHLNNLKKLLSTHEELKENWKNFKEKPSLDNKPKYKRRSGFEKLSSSSTSTQTDTTISKLSSISNCDITETESSTTICDHSHYKKGILIDDPKSLVKCYKKTLNLVKKNETPKDTKPLKMSSSQQTVQFQTGKLKSIPKSSLLSFGTYTVDKKIKPNTHSGHKNKSSITYDIIFKPTKTSSSHDSELSSTSNEQFNGQKIPKTSKTVSSQTSNTLFVPKSSLQEYLLSNRPDYVYRAQERQNILSDLASMRDHRKQLKRELLLTNNKENTVPPNPLALKRIMSQKEMRKQTERKYRKCPEVKSKKLEVKRKQEYNTNKIMANIFTKKLQKKTLNGNVDLSNSVSVCSL
ncbi:MATH and LRR domain-containing protein PFE0570w-like isoform X2 [Adelges cooleyi]|uniref:MATH and LRR domain-containing protein PFE0570w-like isoform X2 n=1 Tax=Adelges cooleyi TaxID=133065 RepID=UPI00217FC70C|nr:MATH and LRR domain-containing protein PFE0570w-like isoform X2 [Adelges cooleyi]